MCHKPEYQMDQIKIDVTDKSALAQRQVDTQLLRRTADYVLRQYRINRALVSVAIVDDRTMKSLNKRYLQQSGSTDVLSFDLRSDAADQNENQLDCEVIVNAERALNVAQANERSTEGEMLLYLIHGLLHQLGYDDKTDEQADRMHRKEDELLNELGFGCVYKIKR